MPGVSSSFPFLRGRIRHNGSERADSVLVHAPFCLSVVACQSQEACFALELGSEVEGEEVPLVKVMAVRERVPEGRHGANICPCGNQAASERGGKFPKGTRIYIGKPLVFLNMKTSAF